MTTLTCPSCGAAREIPADRLPKARARVTCRKCSAQFEFVPDLSAPPDDPLELDWGDRSAPAPEAAPVAASVAPMVGVVEHPPEPAPSATSEAPAAAGFAGSSIDLRLELKLRLAAIPVALLLAALVHLSQLGAFLQRTFLSMMLHETGHAVTAWWCGFNAVPTFWVTHISESRGFAMPLLLGALNGVVIYKGVRARNPLFIGAGAASTLLQIVGTLFISPATASALITFGGDGGAMVLGVALAATFFFGRDTQLYRGWLRWGFLAIGCTAFVDCFSTWWSALSNHDAIPFGEQEYSGLSDPSKLVDLCRWNIDSMIHRYVALGVLCLLALGAVWGWGVWQARRELASSGRRSPG
jgi:hypothetical protein